MIQNTEYKHANGTNFINDAYHWLMTRKFWAENPTVLKNTFSTILFSEIYSKLLIYFIIDLNTGIERKEKYNRICTDQYRSDYCSEKFFKHNGRLLIKYHRRSSELKPDHKMADKELKNKTGSACLLKVL